MLYWLTELSDGGDFFNLFRYITFRAGGAFMTSLIFGFIFGLPLINVLRRKQGKGQPIRDDGPEGHFAKAGTPTMGGLLIVGALTTSTLLWARLDNPFVWMVLFVTLSFALIGFADDYAKVAKQTTAGVSGKVRLALGLLIAGIAGFWAAQYHPEGLEYQLAVPVFKDVLINMGVLFVPFSIIVIVGAANAVNLTDGLDGLAIMPVMIASGTLGIIAYFVGRVDGGFDWRRFGFPLVQRATGCCVHGRHRIIGLGWCAGRDCCRLETRDRPCHRRFLMAPIHHHYEKKGWAEPQIVIRFWIISLILAMIGLATLKVR